MALRFNFAGSQQLASQLEHGAEADVFASADARWMAHAERTGRIDGAPAAFAHNRLVVILPRANPARIARLQDLARPGVRVVVGAEAVPVGAYTREVLARLARAPGFDPDYARRVLANVVSEEENVRSVASKVRLGEADAGFVYVSDLGGDLAGQVEAIPIADSLNVIATYPVAVVRGSPRADLARDFVALLRSAEGAAVLERHRLIPVGP